MKNKALVLTSISLVAIMLSGCGPSEQYTKRKQLEKNPEINNLGIIDGCELKYVNRGYQSDSFYMARCGNTTTTTSDTGGKNSTRRTMITSDEETPEEKSFRMRERALKKLTPEEKEAFLTELKKEVTPNDEKLKTN